MTTEAEAIRALAARLASGATLRRALYRWPDDLSGPARSDALVLARRVRLGCSIVAALEGLSFADRLHAPFALHLTHGLALSEWLERTAADLDATEAAAGSARAAAAGALLSGRMVAALPLLFVPLAPMSRAPMTDPLGIALLVVGVVLGLTGLKWIGRLVPRPQSEDAVAAFCASVAALLGAGASLPVALEAACKTDGSSVSRVPSLVRLGLSWPSALSAADESFRPVSDALRRAFALGSPLATTLRALERRRRAEALLEFDRAVRRAPVLMVVPLVCCVLPAFGLLGLAPFLRSMSLA